MQMFTSLRCRSLCILLLRVYASLHTTQNPLSWILFHEKQSLISQPLSFAMFFVTSDWVRYRSHGVLRKIRCLGFCFTASSRSLCFTNVKLSFTFSPLLRVYASLRTTQNPQFGMTFSLFVKFCMTVRYLLNDSVISPKTVI